MHQHDDGRAARRRDRELLDRTARWLRTEAIRSGYAGFRHQHVAFALALILDELARHLVDLNDAVRRQAVQSCHRLLDGPRT